MVKTMAKRVNKGTNLSIEDWINEQVLKKQFPEIWKAGYRFAFVESTFLDGDDIIFDSENVGFQLFAAWLGLEGIEAINR